MVHAKNKSLPSFCKNLEKKSEKVQHKRIEKNVSNDFIFEFIQFNSFNFQFIFNS